LAADALVVGQPTKVAVVIDVVDGWHINANPAQPDYVIPTTLTGKTKGGATLTGARYPAGHEFNVEGIDEALSVYEGKIVLYGTITVPESAAAGADELQIGIKYQACNDENCLRPVTIPLSGKVIVAPAGTQAKPINQKLFAPVK
ncbi:MAG: hypothetical protein KDA90_14960, partial [Planctomycetaceae bacterium]|nr:hypothetical protein [Planctomycetaceae bacterium]